MCKIIDEVPSMSDEDFLKYFSSFTLKAREKVTEDLTKSPEDCRQHTQQVPLTQSDIEYMLYRDELLRHK